MRLHAYLTQAILPGIDRLQFAQLPGIMLDELTSFAPDAKDLDDFVQALEEKQDVRLMDTRKAMEKWGRIEIADAAFKGVPYVCHEPYMHLLTHSMHIDQ
jgi:translocation protein SEC63